MYMHLLVGTFLILMFYTWYHPATLCSNNIFPLKMLNASL